VRHDESAQHKDALSSHISRHMMYKYSGELHNYDGNRTDAGAGTSSASRQASRSRGNQTSSLLDIDGLDAESIVYHPTDGELALFRSVYYAAMHNVANMQVNSLLELQRLNGLKCHFVGISDNTLKDIQYSLSFVLDKELIGGVTKSDYFGLILDESTDISVHKKTSCLCSLC
jgi:hypothetical protein